MENFSGTLCALINYHELQLPDSWLIFTNLYQNSLRIFICYIHLKDQIKLYNIQCTYSSVCHHGRKIKIQQNATSIPDHIFTWCCCYCTWYKESMMQLRKYPVIFQSISCYLVALICMSLWIVLYSNRCKMQWL